MSKKTIPAVLAVLTCALLLIIGYLPDQPELQPDQTESVTAAAEPATTETAAAEPVTAVTTAITAAESTEITTVETTAVRISAETESTEPPTPPADPNAPVLMPPEPSGKPCDFYDDAAFIGDSVSVMLSWYAANGELGDPVFLTRESYSMAHAAWGTMLVEYNGKEMPPEDALAASGVSKVFIMLGMNDIAVYGIDRTIEHWKTVLPRIREKCPDIEIYIQSCTPIYTGGEIGALNNVHIDEFNARLKELADEEGCPFADIAPYMKDSTGGLAGIYCSDGYVHLTNEGASAWVKVLLAYAEEMQSS